MLIPWKGNTTNEAFSNPKNLPLKIEGFSIVNKSGGATSVNVYLFGDSYSYCIAPNPVQLSTGEMYESQNPIVLLATERVKIKANGSVDYNFTFSNLTE